MKARVKATGDIFEVSDTTTIYPEHYDKSYNITEVEFLDVKENAFPKDDNPDYWTRLEHQYAGMAMQGMIKTYKQMMRSDIECRMDCMEHVDVEVANGVLRSHAEACAELCIEFATALVERLKGEQHVI